MSNHDAESRLTRDEKRGLTESLSQGGCWGYEECCWQSFESMIPAVERIIAARTAQAREDGIDKAVPSDPSGPASQIPTNAGEGALRERIEVAASCPHGQRHYYGIDAICRKCEMPSWVEALFRAALTDTAGDPT